MDLRTSLDRLVSVAKRRWAVRSAAGTDRGLVCRRLIANLSESGMKRHRKALWPIHSPGRARRTGVPQTRRCRLEPLEPRAMLSAAAVVDHLFYNAGGQSPAATAASQGSATPPSGAFTPQQIDQAYGINSITFGSVAGDGTGQTIAIVDAYDDPDLLNSTNANFATSDLGQFDAQFHLASAELCQSEPDGRFDASRAGPGRPGATSWEGEEAPTWNGPMPWRPGPASCWWRPIAITSAT